MNAIRKRIKCSLNKFEKRSFPSKVELVYKGHVPFVAFFIYAGCIELYKNNKKVEIVNEGEFVGLENFIEKTPVNFSIVAAPNSILFIIDRSTMSEISNF